MDKENVNVYEREKLYEQVWSQPVIHVAKLYGVSNVAIKKICKSMNIPTPPNGYWAKLRNGHKVHKTPLPPAKRGKDLKYGITSDANKVESNDPLSFLGIEEHKTLHEVIRLLKIVEDDFCYEILELQKRVDEWNSNNASMEGFKSSYREYRFFRSHDSAGKYQRPPLLAGVLSKNGLNRAYKILNGLIMGMKMLGYSVNDDMSFQIRGEKVGFYIYEKQSYFKHVNTPEEKKILEKYEKEKIRNPYTQEPYIPKEDYLFNGELLFSAKKYSYIKDKSENPIEERLFDMFMQLIQKSEIIKKERLAKEEQERERREEKRLRDLPIITYNEEVDDLKSLLSYANDFDMACRIRRFVNHLEESRNTTENAEFISWAREKADWYDPTISRTDEILGARNHDSDTIPEKREVPRY